MDFSITMPQSLNQEAPQLQQPRHDFSLLKLLLYFFLYYRSFKDIFLKYTRNHFDRIMEFI